MSEAGQEGPGSSWKLPSLLQLWLCLTNNNSLGPRSRRTQSSGHAPTTSPASLPIMQSLYSQSSRTSLLRMLCRSPFLEPSNTHVQVSKSHLLFRAGTNTVPSTSSSLLIWSRVTAVFCYEWHRNQLAFGLCLPLQGLPLARELSVVGTNSFTSAPGPNT